MTDQPIRYLWDNIKLYKWGCPRCDYTTFHDTILCMHTIKEHDLNVRDDIMAGIYTLKDRIK